MPKNSRVQFSDSLLEQKVYTFGGVVFDSQSEKRAARKAWKQYIEENNMEFASRQEKRAAKKAWVEAEYGSDPVELDEAARLAAEEAARIAAEESTPASWSQTPGSSQRPLLRRPRSTTVGRAWP